MGDMVALRCLTDWVQYFPAAFPLPCPLSQSIINNYHPHHHPTAGDSILSEALSFEIFSRAFGCSLLETEMEVHYFPRGSSIIDYTAVVEEDDIIVGVSVTRCMDAPHRAMDADGALRLIRKKMRGLLSAEANISKLFAWDRSVLHVLCDTEANADLITAAYAELDAEEKDNVVVVISTVDGAPWAFESTRGKKKADQ